MKIILKTGDSKIVTDDGEPILEVKGGTTEDASRIFAGAMPPLVKFFITPEEEEPLSGDETPPDDDEDEEDAVG